MDEAGKVMKFISEKQIEEIRKTRGDQPEDGPIVPARPLYEVLKEAKDKKQADFEETYLKHRPPKALDDDETEFLAAVEQQKREREKEQAEEEARELTNFQTALASRTVLAYEDVRKQSSSHQDPALHEGRVAKAKKPVVQTRILPSIRVLPVAKKPKPLPVAKKRKVETTAKKDGERGTVNTSGPARMEGRPEEEVSKSGLAGLMSYGSDVDDEDDDER